MSANQLRADQGSEDFSGVDRGSFHGQPKTNRDSRHYSPCHLNLLYFATHPLCPPNTGGRLRDYKLARELSTRCSVTFAEMLSIGETQSKQTEHREFGEVISLNRERSYSSSKLVRGLIGPIPVTVLNYWSRTTAAQLRGFLRSGQFQTVQIEGLHLMEYLPIIRKSLGWPAIVVDWHNIDSELMWRYAATPGNAFKRLAARRTAKLIEKAEDRLLNSCDLHTVTSERERKKLLNRNPHANIQVIPNGVDIAHYSPRNLFESFVKLGRERPHRSIIFVGSMDYHANVDAVLWFSRTVWPEIACKYPDIHFMIVGRNPLPEICRLDSDRIHVTGTVDDVRPFYCSAIAAVVPIRSGSGTRLKIMEAMAAGVPVVSTHLGAEGIDIRPNIHYLAANTESEILVSLKQILTSDETRSRLTASAKALVAAQYDWRLIGDCLYRAHSELVETRQLHKFRDPI